MTTPDPSMFVWAGTASFTKLEDFEAIGLLKCRSEEGKQEMCRALRVPDMPPGTPELPAGSVFIPGSNLYLKPDYKTCRIGLVVPRRKVLPDGEVIIYPGSKSATEIYLGGYSILACVGGLYTCNYYGGYNSKVHNQHHVKKALEAELYEVRLDIPSWMYKSQVIDLVEEGKKLVKKREGQLAIGREASLES